MVNLVLGIGKSSYSIYMTSERYLDNNSNYIPIFVPLNPDLIINCILSGSETNI